MHLLDEFWSHSWFNWLKLAKKSLNALVFPFCHQPQQGQSCPMMDVSQAVAAGSMVWQQEWGPEWPCGPRREGHGCGAHPRSSPSAAEGCKDEWTLRCDGAILSDPSKSCGSQLWGCAPQRHLWGVPASQPGHSAVENLTILLLRCNPASSRDAKLTEDPLHYEGHTLSPVLQCSGACSEGPAASKALQLCVQPCSRGSSSAQPLAAFDPAQPRDAAELCPSGTTSHPIKLLCAVISISVVSWSSGRVFDQKLISGSKMLWIHTLFLF